jgi:hypothetical protein
MVNNFFQAGFMANGAETLTDRVRDRVAEAARSLDKPAGRGSKNSKLSKLHHTRLTSLAGTPKANSETLKEQRSLRQVYRELRGTYRRHRRTSGQAALPELREAVHAFKKGPSLVSLVAVAAFLDERGLLAW